MGKYMTRESKPEFPLLLLLLSHLRQAGTWTKVSWSIKMQRQYKGRKSAACMHSWDKLWATRYKKIKPQLPLLRCWEQKQGTLHQIPPKEWANHLSHPSGLKSGPTLTLSPYKELAHPILEERALESVTYFHSPTAATVSVKPCLNFLSDLLSISVD